MQKLYRIILVVIISGLSFNWLSAQTTILEQSMLTQPSFDTFTTVSLTGPQSWYRSSIYGAVCSGYSAGQNFENEDWLISPIMNLAQTDNVKLTFNHTRGNAGSLNVGVAEGWYKVFATANYSGDPTTTQWVELTGFNQAVPVTWQFISSGEILIPEGAKSENSRIAFRYYSSATQSATWEIKNIKVVGEPQATSANAGIFKITNWNTEWLGCTQFGPTDETQQINNVVAAMLAMNSDIYCLQEISNSVANPTMATLVSLMGAENWGSAIAPSTSGDCEQRQGIIYKKSKVQVVNSSQLSNGIAAQGNSYYYNWSSGRYPALYNVNLLAGNTVIPVSLVNIHAKAEDGVAASYTRRLGASQGLKPVLDGATFNSKNLIFIGDFNDYLVGTTSTACNCTDSPYKNFVDDQTNYSALTQTLTNTTASTPIIEHIIISNELTGNYVSNSVRREASVADTIVNYYSTTSNHLPVSATFQFSVLANAEFSPTLSSSLTVYPNPVQDELHYDNTGLANLPVTIYDLTGRQMRCETLTPHSIHVSSFPAGIYILKVGNQLGKFVKE